MNNYITKELVIELRDGNHKAFDTIFFAYYGKIKFFVKGLLRNEEDAEEIAQDIFVKLWSTRESLNPEKSIASFMYTLARNAALNFLKHKLVESSYLNSFDYNDYFDSSEEILFAKETMLLVEMAVSTMPEQRRKIYDMSRKDGLKNDEIAEILRISKKTVENQLSLALKDIRKVVSMMILFFS